MAQASQQHNDRGWPDVWEGSLFPTPFGSQQHLANSKARLRLRRCEVKSGVRAAAFGTGTGHPQPPAAYIPALHRHRRRRERPRWRPATRGIPRRNLRLGILAPTRGPLVRVSDYRRPSFLTMGKFYSGALLQTSKTKSLLLLLLGKLELRT